MHTKQHSKHTVTALALAATALLISSCATLFPPDCAKFEEKRKTADYSTHYAYSEGKSEKLGKEMKPLGRRTADAPLYKMDAADASARTCTDQSLRKQLYLQRISSPNLIFEETREIYAENGRLIAIKRENLTEQLAKTGYYSAKVPLPIPETTPAGKYRVRSLLSYQTKGARRATVLAHAETSFTVLPKKK